MYILYIELSNYAQKTLCNSRFTIKKSTSNYARIMLELCSNYAQKSYVIVGLQSISNYAMTFTFLNLDTFTNTIIPCVLTSETRQSIQTIHFRSG